MPKFKKHTEIADVKGVFDTVKAVASAHLGISSFDWGEFQLDFATTNLYPLFFLELPFSVTEAKQSETYSFAFQLADKMDQGMERDETIVLLSKCKQIASEICLALSEVFMAVDSSLSFVTFTGEGNDLVCGVRVELTVTTKRAVAACDDVFRTTF